MPLVLDASVPYFNLDSLPARQSLTVLHRLPENENGLLTPFDLRSGEKEGGGAFDPGNVCCLTPGDAQILTCTWRLIEQAQRNLPPIKLNIIVS